MSHKKSNFPGLSVCTIEHTNENTEIFWKLNFTILGIFTKYLVILRQFWKNVKSPEISRKFLKDGSTAVLNTLQIWIFTLNQKWQVKLKFFWIQNFRMQNVWQRFMLLQNRKFESLYARPWWNVINLKIIARSPTRNAYFPLVCKTCNYDETSKNRPLRIWFLNSSAEDM